MTLALAMATVTSAGLWAGVADLRITEVNPATGEVEATRTTNWLSADPTAGSFSTLPLSIAQTGVGQFQAAFDRPAPPLGFIRIKSSP